MLMARNASLPHNLDTDGRLDAAIALLVALTSSSTSSIDVEQFAHEQALTSENVEEVLELLQMVSDDATGARIALVRDGARVSLVGDAGRLGPVRFTCDEAMAVMQVLDRFQINDETRTHIRAALDPAMSAGQPQLLAGDPLFGGFYQLIYEAMAIGGRLRVVYQSLGENAPRERLIDPGYFMVAGDAAYLVAWDVTKDEQRSYRLDRMVEAELTEDSVEVHDFVREDLASSLGSDGREALLKFSSAQTFDRCAWEGLRRADAVEQADGSVVARVNYTSATWLFDQVLAAGGEIEILEPVELRSELVAHGEKLLQELLGRSLEK